MEANVEILINESGMRMIFDQFIDRSVDLLLDVTAQALGGFTARRRKLVLGGMPFFSRQARSFALRRRFSRSRLCCRAILP